MPTPKKAGRFGGTAAHHNRIVANLATDLIRHGRVRTTHARAKTVQPTAERLITFAKRGDIHSRRQARKIVRDTDVLHHLFAEVGPVFADRNGGYTRVLKLGPRKGDAAPMALLEFVAEVGRVEEEAQDEPRRRWSLRRRQGEQRPAGAGAPRPGTAPADVGEPEEAEGEPQDGEPAVTDATEADPAEVEARLGAEEGEPGPGGTESEGGEEGEAGEDGESGDRR